MDIEDGTDNYKEVAGEDKDNSKYGVKHFLCMIFSCSKYSNFEKKHLFVTIT